MDTKGKEGMSPIVSGQLSLEILEDFKSVSSVPTYNLQQRFGISV